MISTPEGFTYNIRRYPMNQTPVNKPSTRKSLRIFTNILDVKNKTAIYQVRDSNSKRKAIKVGSTIWAMKTKRRVNSKINDRIKK